MYVIQVSVNYYSHFISCFTDHINHYITINKNKTVYNTERHSSYDISVCSCLFLMNYTTMYTSTQRIHIQKTQCDNA